LKSFQKVSGRSLSQGGFENSWGGGYRPTCPRKYDMGGGFLTPPKGVEYPPKVKGKKGAQ